MTWSAEYHAGCSVLNSLQSVQFVIGQAREKCVAIIYAGEDKGNGKLVGSANSEVLADFAYATEVEVEGFAEVTDLSFLRQEFIQVNTKIADRVGKNNFTFRNGQGDNVNLLKL